MIEIDFLQGHDNRKSKRLCWQLNGSSQWTLWVIAAAVVLTVMAFYLLTTALSEHAPKKVQLVTINTQITEQKHFAGVLTNDVENEEVIDTGAHTSCPPLLATASNMEQAVTLKGVVRAGQQAVLLISAAEQVHLLASKVALGDDGVTSRESLRLSTQVSWQNGNDESRVMGSEVTISPPQSVVLAQQNQNCYTELTY